MLSVKFFIALIVVALFATIFVLFSERIIPQYIGTQSNTTVLASDEQVEAAKVETVELISTATAPAGFQIASQKDGTSLLKIHCSQCHVVQSLEKYNKSRSEWQLTLTKMETLGVSLNDAERVILLDYLTSVANP